MNFTINELDAKLFHAETQMNAMEHPHIYLQWMHIKMTEKLLNEMKKLNASLQQQKV